MNTNDITMKNSQSCCKMKNHEKQFFKIYFLTNQNFSMKFYQQLYFCIRKRLTSQKNQFSLILPRKLSKNCCLIKYCLSSHYRIGPL